MLRSFASQTVSRRLRCPALVVGVLFGHARGPALAFGFAEADVMRRVVLPAPRSADAGMPPDGLYALGLRLDAEGRFSEAVQKHELAVAELLRPTGGVPPNEGARRLVEKARWEAELSGLLGGRSYQRPFEPLALRPDDGLARRARQARAYHAKWLTLRGFHGQAVPMLLRRALEQYAGVVAERPDPGDRLALAALLWASGARLSAEREAARVPAELRGRPELAIDVAMWHAARGEAEAAVQALDRAPGRLRAELLAASVWDLVRPSAAFAALVQARRG